MQHVKLVFVDCFSVLFFNVGTKVECISSSHALRLYGGPYLYKKMCLKQPPVFTIDSSVSTVSSHTVHVVGNHLGPKVKKWDPRVSW